MAGKKIVLIDLDQTLIDTEKIKKDRDVLLRRFGVPRGVITSARKRMDGKLFHPDILFDHIRRLTGGKYYTPAMKNLYNTLFSKYETYNFPGVSPFLATLSRRYELVLLSYGHRHFQLKKFRQTRLGKFFKEAVVTSNLHKKKDLASFFKKHRSDVLLIDDSKSVISAARDVGMKAILVRKNGKNKAYYRKLLKRIEATLG